MSVEWKAEIPTWTRGWAKRPVKNAPPILVEFLGCETDSGQPEIHGVTGGYYGVVAGCVERGWTFGPSLPSPEACALADRAPEVFQLLRDCLWTMRKLRRSKTPTKEEDAVSALLLSVTPAAPANSDAVNLVCDKCGKPPVDPDATHRVCRSVVGVLAGRFVYCPGRIVEAPAAQAEGGSGKVDVYVRPECLFHYCPHPDVCRADDRCHSQYRPQ